MFLSKKMGIPGSVTVACYQTNLFLCKKNLIQCNIIYALVNSTTTVTAVLPYVPLMNSIIKLKQIHLTHHKYFCYRANGCGGVVDRMLLATAV